jgi:multiple sugar transport system permease protein
MANGKVQRATFAKKFATHVVLFVVGVTMLFPFLWMLATSLKSEGEVFQHFDNIFKALLPSQFHWDNYRKVYEVTEAMGGGFLRWYFNSFFVAVVVTLGQVATSACAAYAFARLQFPGRDKLFLGYLATMMIPGAVTMIPNFILLSKMPELMAHSFGRIWDSYLVMDVAGREYPIGRLVGIDSYFALIVPAMFSAYGTFMLRQFFMGIPRDLEEAATIDGCGLFRIFTTIIIPLSKPALATLTIFTFMGNWRNFMWPLIVVNSDYLKTLPVGLQTFQGLYSTQWTLLMAGSMMMILPMIVVFLFGQRFFVSGIQLGALKG